MGDKLSRHMTNQEIAKTLSNIAEYLEMTDVPFKPRAYVRVAEAIAAMSESVDRLYREKGASALRSIPGVGASIAEHIKELVTTGHLAYYDQLKKKTPVDLETLTAVEGLGPKKIKVLYEKLRVRTLADLERVAKAGKIKKLEGFGEKSEENILKGIAFVKSSGGRFLLGDAMREAKQIELGLQKIPGIHSFDIVGSFRRRKETIGDIDILVVSDRPHVIMEAFTNLPNVARVYAKGDTKSMVRLQGGIDADLRVVPQESYGAALSYFTGSKDHNIALRKIAIEKKLKLNEYGLFASDKRKATGKMIAGKTEEEIYAKLGLDFIPPELREMGGEIEAAKNHTLPKLIGYEDLRGDLQTQTNWTDGNASIEEMAKEAIKRGLEYIAITDHTKRLAMTHGLDARRIVEQMKEIDNLNATSDKRHGKGKFRILKGTECDILRDGSLDLPDEILRQLDVVGVSVHSLFNLSREDQTKRIVRAMRNPHADILFHPTGRLIHKREPYAVDMSEIIDVARETNTVLEVDALSERLDLKDEHIRMAVQKGVKLAIDSDAHAPSQFSVLEFGIAQARRGWATREDIINTFSAEKMLSMLKDGR
jgi:DNA polymerase (family 10)